MCWQEYRNSFLSSKRNLYYSAHDNQLFVVRCVELEVKEVMKVSKSFILFETFHEFTSSV
jgi:hypothetical protein